MFDLGVPTDFLGIELIYVNAKDSATGRAYCWMHQKRYTAEVLKRFGMLDCKGIASPWSAGVLLDPDDQLELADADFKYSEVCGSVIYLKTRPHITYTVSKLCKFMKKVTSAAVQAAKCLLRYLKQTMDYGICFGVNDFGVTTDGITLRKNPELRRYQSHFLNNELFACSDSAFADQSYNGRSTYGFNLFFNGGCLVHKSREFGSVLGSTVATEYVALSEAGRAIKAMQQYDNNMHPMH